MDTAHQRQRSGSSSSTVRDVAAAAGVSVATVSRVLTGKYQVATATRDRVLRAMTELNYVANPYARGLAGNPSRPVGIVLDNLTAGLFNHIAHGVEEQAGVENLLCLVATTQGRPGRELALAAKMREQNAAAVVLIGGVEDTPEYHERVIELARSLDAAGSRLVLCGRPSPDPDAPITVVDYDNEGGAFAVTSQLLSVGHQRVLFLGGTNTTTTAARIAGFRRAMAAYGYDVDPELIVVGEFTRRFGLTAMRRLLTSGAPEFTGVFAADDNVAGGAMKALREAGIDVPEQMSMVGFNDTSYTAEDMMPALTTVHIPVEQLGRTAVSLALHRNDPGPARDQQVVLGTHVVVRESIRPLVRRVF